MTNSTKSGFQLLLASATMALLLFGCSSDADTSADETESVISKMAQNDPSMPKPPERPGLESDIGFDTTRIDDYRLIGRSNYANGSPRRVVVGLDTAAQARVLTINFDENGNRIEETESSGRLRDGRFIRWYPNGNLNAVQYYKANKKVDTSYLYWENGCLKQILTYEDDLKNGLWEQYNEQGIKVKQGIYANDSLNGEYTAWNNVGGLEYTGFYKDDKMTGKWEKFYASGRIKAVTNYENGVRNGTYVVWDELGFPMAELYFVNGEERDWPDSIPHARAINPPPAPDFSPDLPKRDSTTMPGN